MKSINLSDFINIPSLEVGNIALRGTTGRIYNNQAIKIPGYGWIPCSRKLQANFSNKTNDLMLVILDTYEEQSEIVTSDIWVTRSNLLGSFRRENNKRSISQFMLEQESDIEFFNDKDKGLYAVLTRNNKKVLCDQTILEKYEEKGTLDDIGSYYVVDILDSENNPIPIIKIYKQQ